MILTISYYILSILGILKKQSKVLSVFMLAVMWIVFGLCTYNGDFGNYSWIYQNIQNPAYWTEYEPLFTMFMYVCSRIGLDFIQFRMVFSAVYLILLFITIGQYTNNRAEALGLYMLFPFLGFTSVIRSGFAGILIVFAYHQVIAGHDRKMRFWICMILATLIHYTSVFFAVFFFFRKNKFQRFRVVFLVSLVLGAFVSYYTGIFYKLVSLLTSNYRTLKWFMPGNSGQEIRWIVYLIIIDFMIIFIAYLSKRENYFMERQGITPNVYADDIFFINVTMLIFIPTFFVTNASARFMWEILLLNIVCHAKEDECWFPGPGLCKRQFRRKTAILITFLLMFTFYANLPYRGTVNDGFLVFQNNLLYEPYPQTEQQNIGGYVSLEGDF